MNNPIPSPIPGTNQQPMIEDCHRSDSHILMAIGVVLLVCGEAIFGHHQVTMVGLGLIIFSSLFD
jgi:hypothetical protein